MQEKSTLRELGSIKLDTNLNGHIFIDQDDQDSLFGTRVVLTPSQAEEVCRYVRSVAGGEPPEELEELRAWKASAMVQLGKADALRELLPMPDYWGWDVYDATADYIKKLVAGGEPPKDRGSDAVKACLRFIRQCVAGKCDELDLEVIRGEIDGVLRVAGGEPEQPSVRFIWAASPEIRELLKEIVAVGQPYLEDCDEIGMKDSGWKAKMPKLSQWLSICARAKRLYDKAALPAPPQGKEQKR